MGKKLERTSPDQVGLSARGIMDFVERIGGNGAHSFMILRHGKVAAEGYWYPYREAFNHVLYSLSKSFTSTAIGFAVQEDILSIEDIVYPFFADRLEGLPCENMMRLRIKDLLMMATGHREEPPIFEGEDWVKAFLTSYIDRTPGEEPEEGSLFLYQTPATFMLSAILQKVTGEKLIDFLRPRLLEPLAIEGIWSEESPDGICTGGYGLNVKTEHIARFGQFLLQEGRWEGKQLLSKEWIREATGKRISNDGGEGDWACGYGYQFWRCSPQGVYRGDGMHGQYCVVFPEQDMVVVMTAGTADMPANLTAAFECLLPGLDKEQSQEDTDALADLTANLQMPVPVGEADSGKASMVSGKRYEIGDNVVGISELSFTFGIDTSISGKIAGTEFSIRVRHGVWVDNGPEGNAYFDSFNGHFFTQTSCSGAWVDDNYHAEIIYNRTPYRDSLRAEFFSGGVKIWLETYPNLLKRPSKLVLIGKEITE